MNHHPERYTPQRAAEQAPSATEQPSSEALTLDAISAALRDHGPAFTAWAQFHDADPDMLALFADHYIGHYDSLEQLGRQLVPTATTQLTVLGRLAPYARIDYKALAEDELSATDCITLPATDGGFYLFHGPDHDGPVPPQP